MLPLVFMVDASIHKDDEIIKKQFLFASRKEVELFKDALVEDLKAEIEDYKKTALEYYRENATLRADNAKLTDYAEKLKIIIKTYQQMVEEHSARESRLQTTVTRLKKENSTLQNALRPFADEAQYFEPAWKDRPDPTVFHYPHWDVEDPPGFTIGDLRAARAAMGESDE